jgi:vacuolar-type H+-ATPase subunit D/Vma8
MNLLIAVQTALLLVMAAAQIKTMLLLGNEMKAAATAMRKMIDELKETRSRVDALERRR